MELPQYTHLLLLSFWEKRLRACDVIGFPGREIDGRLPECERQSSAASSVAVNACCASSEERPDTVPSQT